MMNADLPLNRCDESTALRAVDRLRAAHPGADSMADRLEQAIRNRRIPEEVLVQHSRWCNTSGSWVSGVSAARASALAMYGFVPDRLIGGDGRSDAEMQGRLAEYRQRLSQ
jgi:hypothetical protein